MNAFRAARAMREVRDEASIFEAVDALVKDPVEASTIDRKSGSAGTPSPISALSPSSALFRSDERVPGGAGDARGARRGVDLRGGRRAVEGPGRGVHDRSEERVSRNAEPDLCTLSLLGALPI